MENKEKLYRSQAYLTEEAIKAMNEIYNIRLLNGQRISKSKIMSLALVYYLNNSPECIAKKR